MQTESSSSRSSGTSFAVHGFWSLYYFWFSQVFDRYVVYHSPYPLSSPSTPFSLVICSLQSSEPFLLTLEYFTGSSSSFQSSLSTALQTSFWHDVSFIPSHPIPVRRRTLKHPTPFSLPPSSSSNEFSSECSTPPLPVAPKLCKKAS